MVNLTVFDRTKIPAGKLAAHVLWIGEDNRVEVVDTFLPCEDIDEAMSTLKYRADSYISNGNLSSTDFDMFTIADTLCNPVIYKIQFYKTAYQLNFVEII